MFRKIQIQSIILILSTFFFSIVWSLISIMRYNAFNSGVLDLGVNSQLLFNVFHGGLVASANNNHPIAANKLIYLFLTPFYNIYPNPTVLLIFQSFWISLSAIPMYLIAEHKIKNKWYSLIIACSYLLYYPISGANWFDFHYMALFGTFFLFGYYLYLKKRKKSSFVLLALSAMTDLLVPIILGIFALFIIFKEFQEEHKKPYKNYFAVSIFFFSASLFIFADLYQGTGLTSQYTTGALHTILSNQPYSLQNKLLYFVYLMIPVLFLSLFGLEYLVLMIPYFIFVLLNNNPPFTSTMFYQYPMLVSPLIFIALIYGLFRFFRILSRKGVKKLSGYVMASLLIINILMASLFTPVGNIITHYNVNPSIQHSLTGNDGNYNAIQSIRYTYQDEALNKIISFIPRGSTILIQGNMPQLSNDYNWGLPFSLQNDTFPQYVVTDPYSPFFTQYSYPQPDNFTMLTAFNHLFSTGKYGIYAEAYGIILLKFDYKGLPIYYKPLSNSYPPKSLILNTDHYIVNGTAFFPSLRNNSVAWYGPYSFLSPGNYSITISMMTNNTSTNNSFLFEVANTLIYNGPSNITFSHNITGNDFTKPNIVMNITFNFQTNVYLNLVEYRAFYANWNGTLALSSIQIIQTSYN